MQLVFLPRTPIDRLQPATLSAPRRDAGNVVDRIAWVATSISFTERSRLTEMT